MIGFLCTFGPSAGYALLLCLMQLSFEKVLKKESFYVLLQTLIWTCILGASVSLICLFAIGHEELDGVKIVAMLLAILGYNL
ncbi:putative purine permease, plant [Medicago truncatula]|uniref:Putative purine permease, plant n=1 Tax=Medicago truncatula TaxID=3880 RepID=A0A396J926_MEDTR|nr:putative purine permease, plant [Medicago truncatula]